MLRGTVVAHTFSPKNRFSSAVTCWARFVRSLNMVSRTPSISSVGLKLDRIRSTVSSNSLIPSRAKYSACIGIKTVSAATSAFRVSKSRAGGQSRTMNWKRSRTGANAFRRRNSRCSASTNSILAPIRFLWEGISQSCSSSVVWSASSA